MSVTSLNKLYQTAIDSDGIVADPLQREVIAKFQRIYDDITRLQKKRLKVFLPKQKKRIQGLYLWGGVGIGKTFLMDLFFNHLPVERKRRVHFHRFMKQVHDDLFRLYGRQDPLSIIAREFSLHYDVLCFDEFLINDIADAAILGGLFGALFQRGVCIILTSNTHPDQLYQHGLQRKRFIPAIELLKENMEVFHLQSARDYRVQNLEQRGVYFTPLDHQAEQALQECFSFFAHCDITHEKSLLIANRKIKTIAYAKYVVWFDFDIICHSPRSQNDYLELAKLFSIVIISNVPALEQRSLDQVTYFIQLIDIFYDNKIKLILSAAVPINELYAKGSKRQEFARTESRLFEMQTHKYIEFDRSGKDK